MSSYSKILEKEILQSSDNDYCFWDAALEWRVVDCFESEDSSFQCLCGKRKLKTLYRIKNIMNDKIIDNIGSQCMTKFKNDDIKKGIKIMKLKNIKLTNGIYMGKTYGEVSCNFASYCQFLSRKSNLSSEFKKLVEFYTITNIEKTI